jgi:hypothetical protein
MLATGLLWVRNAIHPKAGCGIRRGDPTGKRVSARVSWSVACKFDPAERTAAMPDEIPPAPESPASRDDFALPVAGFQGNPEEIERQWFEQVYGTLVTVVCFHFMVPDASVLGDKYPAPAARTWMTVAKVMSKGFASLRPA